MRWIISAPGFGKFYHTSIKNTSPGVSNTHLLEDRNKNSELIGTTTSAVEISFVEGLFFKYSEDSH